MLDDTLCDRHNVTSRRCGDLQDLEGAEVRFGDVSDARSLALTAFREPVDVVVSCLASRTGGKVLLPLLCRMHCTAAKKCM